MGSTERVAAVRLSQGPGGVVATRSVGADDSTAPVAGAEERAGRDAFEAALRPHYAALVRRLCVVLGDPHDAEDIAQDAYLNAFRSWGRFDGVDVRAWLYTIALRLAFNQLRRRRRWFGILADRRLGGEEAAPWSDVVDPDLAAALARLDGRTRAALLLNVVDGYTRREVAEMFGVPEGTVASWLARGRSTLRAELSSDE